jgi:ribosomal protein S18 acetylase RimI-like enzyme
MKIRSAEEKDISRLNQLLSEVLEIHAKIRPDIFVPGTVKYSAAELKEMLQDEKIRIYAAVNEKDVLIGYAFCLIKDTDGASNMVPHKKIFIDDLCVDSSARGMHVGEQLFDYVKQQAAVLGCYEVSLAVWEGNDAARGFYEHIGMKPKETIMEYILPEEDQKK